MSQDLIPYPKGRALKLLLGLPSHLYRLGLGSLVSLFPVMILTTRGRKSGQPRHVTLEYRRHGTRIYALSAWGDSPQWYRNLMAHPAATVTIGQRRYSVQAERVTDSTEVLSALNLFRQTAPFYYDPVLARLSSAQRITLRTLSDVADEFTIVRLNIVDAPLALPGIPADRAWVWLLLIGAGVLLSLLLDIRRRFRPGLPSAPDEDHG